MKTLDQASLDALQAAIARSRADAEAAYWAEVLPRLLAESRA